MFWGILILILLLLLLGEKRRRGGEGRMVCVCNGMYAHKSGSSFFLSEGLLEVLDTLTCGGLGMV